MTGHGEKYTRKQEQAIIALMTAPTMADAAKAAGISEITLWRWLQLPAFLQRYREAKRQAFGQAISQLQQAAVDAVRTLRAVATDEEASPSARVSAARAILEIGVKAVEIEDLTARLEELEAKVEGRLADGRP